MQEDRLYRIVEIARAYYLEDRTQAEIASSMSISRSQVSRYLSEAREQGIVQIRVVSPGEKSGELESDLKARFPHLKKVIVAPVFDANPGTLRSIIGRYAANYLIEILKPGQQIAIGCGRTLHAMVKSLPKGDLQNVSVIQTMGNLGHEAHQIDYNEIAREAAKTLGGQAYFVNAPAILGVDSGPAADFIQANPMLERVFALVREAEIFVAGVGSLESDLVYTRFGLITEDELRHLAGRAVGDIFGRFFDIRGNRQLSGFESRIVGIDLDILTRASLAIGIAGGSDKAAPLLGAIRGRYINVLVSDEHTVNTILALDDAYSGNAAKFL